jgi:hypothetical protein
MKNCRYAQGKINDAAADDETRTVTAILSDERVALDFHIIITAGIDFSDYMEYGSVPFAHDIEAPPVAKMLRLEKRGAQLIGTMQFADAETYPFADTAYRLIRGKFLNATSLSWIPVRWERAKDKNRPDGMNFLECTMLEASIVPVPANPGALITARGLGIDTSPLRHWAERILDEGGAHRREAETIYRETRLPTNSRASKEANWKCGASRNLPLDEDSSWDGAASQKAVFEACGFDGDKPDLAKARKAFLAYDASEPKKKGSYKLPFATIKDGRMTAVAAGIRAAASRLSQADIPDDVQESARAVIDEYEGKMSKKDDKRAVVTKRGLYVVSTLAYLLAQAGSIKYDVDREEAAEGDTDSPNPENMLAVLQALAKALTEMAVEEVEELIANFTPVDAAGAERCLAALSFTRAGKKLSKGDQQDLEDIHDHACRSARLMRDHIDHYTDEDLSDDETRGAMFDHAEAIHDHCMRTAEKLRDHIDGRAPADDGAGATKPAGDGAGSGGNDGAARSADERRKKAAALQARALIESA